MSTLRFTLLVVGLFALSFVGVSWADKGFPIMVYRVVPLKPDARIPTFDESVQKGTRKRWENSQTWQSDGNQQRDKLRSELLAASTAYELSPCDDGTKKAMVAAVTDYVSGWLDIRYCRSSVGDCPRSTNARWEAASAAFGTPADVHALSAMRKAIAQGGITPEDFPRSIRDNVAVWIGTPVGGEPQAACILARQAGNRR